MVLDQGLKLCGRNRRNCSRLQIALSNLEEATEKGRDDSEIERNRRLAELESKRRICLRRMNGDMSLNACNEILRTYPDDVALNVALADKLRNRGFPALAITRIRHAMANGGTDLDGSLQAGGKRAFDSRFRVPGRARSRSVQPRAAPRRSRRKPTCSCAAVSCWPASGNQDAALGALLLAQGLRPTDRTIARQALKQLPKGRITDPDQAIARGPGQSRARRARQRHARLAEGARSGRRCRRHRRGPQSRPLAAAQPGAAAMSVDGRHRRLSPPCSLRAPRTRAAYVRTSRNSKRRRSPNRPSSPPPIRWRPHPRPESSPSSTSR